MRLQIVLKDGDSELKAIVGDGGAILYRPTRSLTPNLEVIAKSLSEMAATKEEEQQLLDHVRQSEDMVVLVGKDMCG